MRPARHRASALSLAFAAALLVPATAARANGIEHFDFRDGTVVYDKQTYHLEGGINGKPDPKSPDPIVTIGAPVFGHVDGYTGELAVILIHAHDYGATGDFSELNLYALQNGKRVMVADLPGGDRAEGGLHAARISGNRLVVEVYAPSASGGACCPGFVDTVRYRLVAGKLVMDGKPSRRIAIESKDY